MKTKCDHCGKELTDDDLDSKEVIDTLFKDHNNGKEYSEADHVPIGDTYTEYDIVERLYICPSSEEETEHRETVKDRTTIAED